jgi:CubicO group peptidase (beta-lactamase class C family)
MKALLHGWVEGLARGQPYGSIIIHNGAVAAEWYGNGFGPDSRFEIGSIRKSFNSALIGLGLERGRVDLQKRASEVWPDIIRLGDPAKDAAISLHHLASGVSGWLSLEPPGATFRYNNAAFTAAERVTARMLGFARDEIAPEVSSRFKTALNAESWRCYHFEREFAPGDRDDPGPKLAIDSNLRDLAAWGELWLNAGDWRGQRLIPAEWVARATSRVNPHIPNALYGYNWFVNAGGRLWPEAPDDSFGHPGWGTLKPSGTESGAFLWICPSRRVVAAMVTARSTGFTADFQEVPMPLTTQWLALVMRHVHAGSDPHGGNRP